MTKERRFEMSRFNGLPHVRRSVQSRLQFGLRAMAMALAFACLGTVVQVQARDQASKAPAVRDIRSLSHTEKQQLLERIRKVLRHVLDTTDIESFSGRSAYTPLKVKFRVGLHNEELVIDLGAANGPASSSGAQVPPAVPRACAGLARASRRLPTGWSWPCRLPC